MEREKRIHRERRKSASNDNVKLGQTEFTRQEWIEMMSEAYYQAMKRIKAEEV